MVKVAVIGAGVIGMSSALNLLENQRNLEVTVFSYRDFSDTTSYGPAGIHRLVHPELKQWSRDTFERFCTIYSGSSSADSGLQLISGHIISDDYEWLKQNEAATADVVFNFRWMDPVELAIFYEKYKYGIFSTTFTSQGNLYVPWLQEQFIRLGGQLRRKKVEKLEELSTRFDVVVNCGGIDGGVLAGDPTVFPVRGILIQVKANWIKHFLFAGDDKNYILPGKETVYIGGSREKGSTNTHVTTEERDKIMKRSIGSMPSLKEAPIVSEWAGMRPARQEGPRVELEQISIPGHQPLTVIHNYGHGGNGFTLSWGCAKTVNELFEKSHRRSSKL